MDLLDVLQPFFDWFVEFCDIRMTFGGVSFTVGTVFIWSIIASVLITFWRGIAD